MKKGILLFLLWPFFCNAQFEDFDIAEPETVGMSSDSLEKMNAYFHELVDEQQLAGIQTAVFRKGKLIHFDSYGYSDIEAGKQLDENSIFRIFSMTKPIVSVALMQLYDQGKFALEDPLYKYLPDFKDQFVMVDSTLVPAKQPVRMIDLLRHTSGYSYGRSGNERLDRLYAEAQEIAAIDNKEVVRRLSKLPLQFEPGTDWQYGFSTNICGYLVELFSGLSLDEYLKTKIFAPLGMVDTHFQLPLEKLKDFTVGYGWSDTDELFISEVPKESRYVREVTQFNGGGGLLSTTKDYLRFCQMLLDAGQYNGQRIIQKASLELMWEDHLVEVRKHQERLRLPPGEASFGLGFAIKGDSPDHLQSVYGWGGAVGTYFKIDPKRQLTYIMMIQLSPYRHLGLRARLQGFVNAAVVE